MHLKRIKLYNRNKDMKLEDLILDALSDVYIGNAEITQIGYLDGAESYLKEVLMSADDLGLLSDELKSRIKDWPTLYHLSPYRATILDCFDFQNREAKVLELGAGCGAVTRWLGEHFRDVHAVEGSFQRASIARLRCRDLSNVKVYAANFFDIEFEKQFDIVTLIGVLEYSHLYHPVHKEKPHEAALSTLQLIHRGIKDQGILLLAIENKLGLKYFSGAKEDHSGKLFDGIQGYPDIKTPVSYSAAELSNLLLSAGFTSIDFYLPFPDYKLVQTIFNAQKLAPHTHHYLYNWIKTPFPDRVTQQRTLLFNENLALREISKAGLLKDLSNSFLIIAHKGDKAANRKYLGFSDDDWIARHYSLDRHKDFCKRASLLQTEYGMRVENSKAFDMLKEAIRSNSYFTYTLMTEKFYPGSLLVFSVFEMLASKNFESPFLSLLKKLVVFLHDRFATGQNDEMLMSLLTGDALDVTLWNIIVDEKSGEWNIIDQEFKFNGVIPVDFIIWRNLNHLFIRYRDYFDKDNIFSGRSIEEWTFEYMQKIYPSYNRERFLSAKQFDKSFQNFVNNGVLFEETLSIKKKLCERSANLEDTPRQMKEANPEVSIIIPVFNKVEYTKQCMEALIQNTPGNLYEVIFIDNASTDGTEEFLKSLKGNVKLITNEENRGFAKACNQGAKVASAPYLLFLNNDTEPQSGWLEKLLKVLDKDSSIAAVGSKLLFPDSTIQHAGVIVINDKKLPDPLVARHIYYQQPAALREANLMVTYQALTAACLMFRKSAFEEVGGFDEEYWNGYEDIDLCFKMRAKGWKLVYQPESVVIHHESKSGSERFSRVNDNISRLHSKWLGKITPDFIIEKDGSVIRTAAGEIKPYSVQKLSELQVKVSQPETRKKLTSIVILTHNELEHTKACLESVRRNTPEPHEIIVVDNGSTDGTLDYLKEQVSKFTDIWVIRNTLNRGFAAGSNQGISVAEGEYVLLLNNDTFVTEGWLGRMLDVFRRHPETGIVGPMSNYVSGPQLVTDVGYNNIDELNAFAVRWSGENDEQSFPIYRVVGFCLLAKKEVIRKIGGLDERFGSGNFEDDDFCSRAVLAGYEARVARDVYIHHTGSQTFKGSGIDYKKSLLRNWKLFKAKWGIPVDAPYEKGYPLPLQPPQGFNSYIPLPDVLIDHRVDDSDDRWLEEEIRKQRTPCLTSVVVLTSDQFAYTKKCIKSLRKNTPELHEIIVVDNGSSPKTISWLRKQAKENVDFKLIRGKEKEIETEKDIAKGSNATEITKGGNESWIATGSNRAALSETMEMSGGHVKACNQGISGSSGEYIAVMTDDVVVSKEWLSGMLECLNVSSDAGIVGPMTTNVEGRQNVIKSDYGSPDDLDGFVGAFREKYRYRRMPSRKISGCCMLFRRDLADRVGLFDERFDLYDTAAEDLCFRAALEGYGNIIAGDVFIHHHADMNSPEKRVAADAISIRNKNLFIRKWSKPDNETALKLSAANALHTADEMSQGGMLDEALGVLIKAVKLNSDDRRLHYTLAEILIDGMKFAEAQGILRNIPEGIRQEARWFELAAKCSAAMQSYPEAEEYADRALALNNASPEALNTKGLVALNKGLYMEAEEFFEKALKADRGFAEAYANIGRIKWPSDQEGAFALFEKAFILSPVFRDVVMHYYNAVVSLSRFERAEGIFRDAAALYPVNRRLRFFLMDMLLRTGRYVEAMEMMEEVMITFGIDEDTLTVALEMREKVGPKEIQATGSKGQATGSRIQGVKDSSEKQKQSVHSDPGILESSISLCMIVKDEQDKIGRCLMKIKPAVDEMIVVDTGSADRTKDIAKAFGAKVYDFAWTDSFADARNFSLSKASGRWILILDADEAISFSDHNSLRELVKGARSEPKAYSFSTRNYVNSMNTTRWTANDGTYAEEEKGTGWFPGDKARLFPGGAHIRFEYPVHERVEPSLSRAGIKIVTCDIPIHHYGTLDDGKKSSKAESYYELAKRKVNEMEKPDEKILHEMAVQAGELGKYEEALKHLNRVIAINPGFAPAYQSMGNNYYNLGRYEEALSSYKKAMQLDPDMRDAVLMRSTLEIITGNVEDAVHYLEGLLKKDAEFIPAVAALAAAYFCSGEKNKGVEIVKRLKAMNFNFSAYLSEMARLLNKADSPEYAACLLESAKEADIESE